MTGFVQMGHDYPYKRQQNDNTLVSQFYEGLWLQSSSPSTEISFWHITALKRQQKWWMPLVIHGNPLIIHGNPLIIHGNPLIIHGNPLIIHGDPLIIHGNPLVIHGNPLVIHGNPL